VFREVGEAPLSLTQDNISANVDALAAQLAPPAEPTTRKIWNCLKCGINQALVVRALELVRDAPASTGLSEKGHGQGASQHKMHTLICTDSLCARSFIAESRALTAERSEERATRALEQKIERLVAVVLSTARGITFALYRRKRTRELERQMAVQAWSAATGASSERTTRSSTPLRRPSVWRMPPRHTTRRDVEP